MVYVFLKNYPFHLALKVIDSKMNIELLIIFYSLWISGYVLFFCSTLYSFSFSESPYLSLDLSKLISFYSLFNLFFFQIDMRPHVRTDILLMTVKVVFDTIVVWNPVTWAVYVKIESNRKNNGPIGTASLIVQRNSFLLHKMDSKVCCPLHSMATIIWWDNVGESVLETKTQVQKRSRNTSCH